MTEQPNPDATASIENTLLLREGLLKQQQETIDELKSLVNSLVQEAKSRGKEVEELKAMV